MLDSSVSWPVSIEYLGVPRVEGPGHDVVLLSSLVGQIVAETAGEDDLSVIVYVTSNLGTEFL